MTHDPSTRLDVATYCIIHASTFCRWILPVLSQESVLSDCGTMAVWILTWVWNNEHIILVEVEGKRSSDTKQNESMKVRERQRDRQRDRKTERQTDRHTDTCSTDRPIPGDKINERENIKCHASNTKYTSNSLRTFSECWALSLSESTNERN